MSRSFHVALNRAVALALVLFGSCLHFVSCTRAPAEISGPLRQDAYIWQRAWTSEVTDALPALGTYFAQLIVLSAEVRWSHGNPEIARVALNTEALRRTGRAVGLTLRIGPFPGPFSNADSTAQSLVQLARSILDEAITNGVPVAELQIDFDCAEAKLDGFRLWIQALRAATHPVPLTITVLPSWLKNRSFGELVSACDGFVLQVHSLEKPSRPDALPALCDPGAARAAVARAAQFKRPFRIALPTYGYELAFNPAGRFIGLSAEASPPSWPADSVIRELRADPQALAELIQYWTHQRPAEVAGVIWYRLPVAGDRLNWAPPTLLAVMQGRPPTPALDAVLHTLQPHLIEIELRNLGERDYEGPVRAEVRWSAGQLVASDSWLGFDLTETGARELVIHSKNFRLRPNDRGRIAWVRLDRETELTLALNRSP